jgi:hypothetical protein
MERWAIAVLCAGAAGIAGCGDPIDDFASATWRQLGASFDGLDEHALRVDAQGKLQLLYSVADGGLVYATWDGAAWAKVETGQRVGSFHQLYPMLLFDSQGRAVIGFGDAKLYAKVMRRHPAGGFEMLAGSSNDHKVVRGTPAWLRLDAADNMIALLDEGGMNKACLVHRFDEKGVFTDLGRLAPPDGGPAGPSLAQGADGSTYVSYNAGDKTRLFKHTTGTDWTQVAELAGTSLAMATTPASEVVFAVDGDVVGGTYSPGTQVVKLHNGQPLSMGMPTSKGGGTFTQLQIAPDGRPVVYYPVVPEGFTTLHTLAIWKEGTSWQELPVLYKEVTKVLGDGGAYVSFAVAPGPTIYASYSYLGKLQVFQLEP